MHFGTFDVCYMVGALIGFFGTIMIIFCHFRYVWYTVTFGTLRIGSMFSTPVSFGSLPLTFGTPVATHTRWYTKYIFWYTRIVIGHFRHVWYTISFGTPVAFGTLRIESVLLH